MKTLFFIILIELCTQLHAQTINEEKFERKGFIFGTAIGASHVQLKYSEQASQNETTISLPNFKIGTMISSRAALLIYLPGSLYTYKGSGRKRDRGFEAIVPSVQYWLKNRWWILGGAGLGLDAPAFYDIKNEDERKFHFGSSAIAGTGYEIWRKRNFVMDIQGRMQYGKVKVPDGTMTGLAFNFLIGCNWY